MINSLNHNDLATSRAYSADNVRVGVMSYSKGYSHDGGVD